MKKITKKTPVEEFADTIRDNPKDIIAWCRTEIEEYQKLIKILENKSTKTNRSKL